jgi:hypothetical protein
MIPQTKSFTLLKEQDKQEPPQPPSGRLPRITRLMALAIRFDQMLRQKEVKDYAELASLGQVSRARITQIMHLLGLAPDIQEALLFLPAEQTWRDTISEMHLPARPSGNLLATPARAVCPTVPSVQRVEFRMRDRSGQLAGLQGELSQIDYLPSRPSFVETRLVRPLFGMANLARASQHSWRALFEFWRCLHGTAASPCRMYCSGTRAHRISAQPRILHY